MTGQKMPAAIGRQTVASPALRNSACPAAGLQNSNPSLSRVKEPASIQIEALRQPRMNIAKA
jgi:hypothetical protein